MAYTLKRVREYSYIDDFAKVRGHLSVTIEPGESINEYTVPNTAKLIFCPACWVYDCQMHKNPTEFSFCRFTHRKNAGVPFPEVAPLQEARARILQGEGVEGEYCSKSCYLRLTQAGYARLRDNSQTNPVIKALVRIGVEIFGFMPCLVWNLAGQHFSCQKVFVFMMEEMDVPRFPALMNSETSLEML